MNIKTFISYVKSNLQYQCQKLLVVLHQSKKIWTKGIYIENIYWK